MDTSTTPGMIVPANPAHPPPAPPKPLITDILRTHFCVPGSVFLVEGIDTHMSVGGGHHHHYHHHQRAVRLLLGDGELCIQALLAPSLHGLADAGHVRVGCYVRADAFQVRFLDFGGSDSPPRDDVTGRGGGAEGDPAGMGSAAVRKEKKEKEKRTPRKMVYLLLEDVTLVGWNSMFCSDMSRANINNPAKQQPLREAAAQQSRTKEEGRAVFSDLEGQIESRTTTKLADTRRAASPQPEVVKGGPGVLSSKARPLDSKVNAEADGDDSDADSAFEVMRVSDARATERRVESSTAAPPDSHNKHHQQNNNKSLPWASSDPSKPLKLTSLHSVPNLPYKQNWMVNVLAVVTSLSDVEPSQLPPFAQRSARLADPSTGKQVLLTVFLDPEEFAPRVGAVVLLLGVKNHRFDGGCLKKYVSDRPRNGLRWWYQEPWELGWCDVAGLKAWWESEEEKKKKNGD